LGNRDSEHTRVTQIHGEGSHETTRPGGDACVIVIYGPELGRRVQLGTAPFEIGRSTKNDLPLDQESISRHHARITFDGTSYWVTDLNSTNGTFVNDDAVGERRLEDGDQVRVGRSILKFMTGANIEVHYHEEIYRLMTIDGLTQVYNRRYFDEALEREYNRARRYERALSLIALDIDHFKRVNDTHGHLAGDNLLRQIASAIRPRLRREDILARTGGEEFGILLPEIVLSSARTIADKVRRIVENTPLKVDQHHVPVTISLGCAQLRDEDQSPADLYTRADERLYQAKQGGRNQVAG
jgi:diguanylate cyclase (GGDEF)-like protein